MLSLAAAILLGAVIVAAVVSLAAKRVSQVIARANTAVDRALRLLELLAPAVQAQHDPRSVLQWESYARRLRPKFPEEFAALDRGATREFPFTKAQLQSAHAQWTADWLAWERTHDADYKLKAAAVEHGADAAPGSPLVKARIDAVEREKLDVYQRRYEEYVRVAKGLQALIES